MHVQLKGEKALQDLKITEFSQYIVPLDIQYLKLQGLMRQFYY